jgi:hypothetical protein
MIDKIDIAEPTKDIAIDMLDACTKPFVGETTKDTHPLHDLAIKLLGDSGAFTNSISGCPFKPILQIKPCKVCDILFPRLSGPVEVRCPCARGYSPAAITEVLKAALEKEALWAEDQLAITTKPEELHPTELPIDEKTP